MNFREQIALATPDRDACAGRRWQYVPYDQLTDAAGPLATAEPRTHGLIFLESRDRPRRRPYHKKKLALLLSNQRHFALECAARGFKVIYRSGDADFDALLAETRARHGLGEITVMEPAERALRQRLVGQPGVRVVPNETWLSTREHFLDAVGPEAPWRMDAYYRAERRRTGLLMARGAPLGERFSHDPENRHPWRGTPPAPRPFSVAPDAITREVLDLVALRFSHHWGALDGFDLPCAARDHAALWRHSLTEALPHFGPYEDAMSQHEARLFHTLVSASVNLSRLLPAQLVTDVVAAYDARRVGLASAEGFVRQLLGWREFVRHVHRETDGFRTLDPEGAPNFCEAVEPLPEAWRGGAPSGLRCLDTAVDRVWRDGYAHHIERLMVLSNLATLVGVSPRALTEWFWYGFVDAYDWVVEPNVLAMGTFGAGSCMTTKPYVSGAAYLDRMSDFCEGCQFDPSGRARDRACPVTPMYWDFLSRNAGRLAANERMRVPLAAAARRSEAQRAHAARVTAEVQRTLARGARLAPDLVASCLGPATSEPQS
ncbi:MAG: cryptochrome/photolyase family protein [Myxococcales bacterium]|nr:cryptochrome/photolyase family protein [Myxococcales bacterium]